MSIRFVSAVATFAALAVLTGSAQQKEQKADPTPQPTAAPSEQRKLPAPVPVRVTVLLSRYKDDKRISSMPYHLGAMASGWGVGPKTTLRMGVEVPIPTGGPGASSYTYRSVGTNIDCTASFDEARPEVFRLAFTVVSDSTFNLQTQKPQPSDGDIKSDRPAFRNFNSSFTALLRDGQTMQYTAATDPVSGESMRIDVTLNLMK